MNPNRYVSTGYRQASFLLFRQVLIAIGLAFYVGFAGHAFAMPGLVGDDVFKTDKVSARLIVDREAIVPGQPFKAALHLSIREGWHTYWRFSGDSGAATHLDWNMPQGFSAGPISWPLPHRIPLGPLMNFGYEGEAVHFVEIVPPATLPNADTVTLAAKAEWLVCSDEMCLPEKAQFTLQLRVDGETTQNPEWGLLTGAARRDLPKPKPLEAEFAVADDALQLRFDRAAFPAAQGSLPQIEYYPYRDGVIVHADAQRLFEDETGLYLIMTAGHLFADSVSETALAGLVTIADGRERVGYEIDGRRVERFATALPAPGTAFAFGDTSSPGGLTSTPPAPSSVVFGGSNLNWAAALAMAFLGGLILNLMPCVFPVLSMKALAFARKADAPARERRLQGWIYTAGVLASFIALALVLFALRSSGAAIGWGYQLQSPLVILGLAYLMFGVGLSLSGIFSLGGALGNVGEALTRSDGRLGTFFTGVLAVLVAAPCTAPFMGAAMGYAMLAPAILSLLVFVFLGLGLAAPYLVLAHVPGALKWLPKPGRWMEDLKQFLAFPMYATAAWLVWVLAQQVGPNALFAALIGFVLLGLAVWLVRSSQGRGLRTAFAGLAVLIALAIGGITAQTTNRAIAAPQSPDGIDWQPYSADGVTAAIQANRPVFVDVTAAWCVTCKVNEMGALSAAGVEAAFETQNVLALRADWTNRDAGITQLLQSYGRVGVPLYLYYPGGEGTPIILPQILSENTILTAMAHDQE